MAKKRPDSLADRIARRITEAGPLTVADYMSAVLTDTAGGYYMYGDPFGSAGDFTTAPEISQMFGEMIGLWCADTWQTMGAPSSINLVELGPGRGTLMSDALRAARVLPAFCEAVRVHLVEVSPALRARQRETLAECDIIWHDSIDSLPAAPALVVANEFFDALPVRQFERTESGWQERRVGLAPTPGDPAFVFTSAPAPEGMVARIPADLRDAPVGALVELSPAASTVTVRLADHLREYGGAALIIDYGHDGARPGWSLQAVRAHKKVHPLTAPGDADLTAHVDFAALARAAEATGARVWGPVSQGGFLTALGMLERADRLRAGASTAQADAIDAAVARLTAPEQMGQLFKVLAIGDPALPALAGLPGQGPNRKTADRTAAGS